MSFLHEVVCGHLQGMGSIKESIDKDLLQPRLLKTFLLI